MKGKGRQKNDIPSRKLQVEFVHFLSNYPSRRLSTNLRRMMMEYLMSAVGSEPTHIYDTLHDLNGLFELLEVADEEWENFNSKGKAI